MSTLKREGWKLEIRKDKNGKVIGARGSLAELRLVKEWVDSLREAKVLDARISMGEAMALWDKHGRAES